MNISLRPITPEDLPFLQHLFGTTCEALLSLTDFSDQEKRDFIQQQFNAQHQTYTIRSPQANFDIILQDQQPIGRLYVNRLAQELRVMDIALLPEHQNQGIGTRLMEQLQQEAHTSKCAVSLHVERNNPKAFAWYTRLGFGPRWSSDTHVFMVWPQDVNLEHSI